MASPTVLELFLTLARRPHTTHCLHRNLPSTTKCIRYASNIPSSPPPRHPPQQPTSSGPKIPLHVGLDRNPTRLSAISKIPIPEGRRGETFTPSILSRPLGLPYPPQPGQNSPIDTRSWSERRTEFADPTKAWERRRIYLRSYLRPYFQEWKRMDYNKGKSFRSNERMFKREKALWFPNLWGDTLALSKEAALGVDSSPIMRGKISVVGMQSGQWAEEQVDSFLSVKNNPELESIIGSSGGRAQRVDVNMQGDWMRMLLVKLFKGRLRKMVPEERWRRYFMVKLPRDIRRGLTEEVRDAMGLLNSQVGYVYLVDSDCKIRWAGSGHAWEGEVEGLNRAVERLIQEEALLKTGRPVAAAQKQTRVREPSRVSEMASPSAAAA